MKEKVLFDLDAFGRRLARQQVIEFGDVEMLIELLRNEHGARMSLAAVVDAARAYRSAVRACDGIVAAEQALFAALDTQEKPA